jgi:integrase/recombinase XerD
VLISQIVKKLLKTTAGHTFQRLKKNLRKYFSQEFNRIGGPTSIKKILMGHSLKGDVDLMYYNAQSEEDLKNIL